MLKQKAQILDEDKRIIRVKASDGDYDRDLDRIDPQKWTLPDYNPPLVDTHGTHDTSDRRLGEIINSFYQDSFWWNDIQLDTPEGEAETWTDGEKLANRIWKMAMANKDITFSVGFIPDPDKMSRNAKGGIDFAGQEQTELSVVLLPSNARARNKATIDVIEEVPLRTLITDAIKENFSADLSCYVCELYLKYAIINVYGFENDVYVDKYCKVSYTIIIDNIALGADVTEVESRQVWVEKMKTIKSKAENGFAFADISKQLFVVSEDIKQLTAVMQAKETEEIGTVEETEEIAEEIGTVEEKVDVVTISDTAGNTAVSTQEDDNLTEKQKLGEIDIDSIINSVIDKKFNKS